MESFEYQPIMNKYDVFNVKSTVDEFMKYQLENKYKLTEKTVYEYIQFVLGIIASAFILKSYFHKAPFPHDKWIIILCTIGYLIFSYLIDFFNQWAFGNAFVLYDIKNKQGEIIIRNTINKKLSKKGKIITNKSFKN